MSLQANEPPDPRDFEKKTQDELDDILNSALDELEDDEDFAKAGTESRTEAGTDPQGIKAMEDEDEDEAVKAFQSILEDFSNPDIADSLEKAFRHLSQHAEGEQVLKEGLQAAMAAEVEAAAATAPTSTEGDKTGGEQAKNKGGSHVPGAGAPAAEGNATRAEGRHQGSDPKTNPEAGGAEGDTRGNGLGVGDQQTDMDRTIAKTLEMLSKSGAKLEGAEAASMEAAGEDVMRQMMGEFEKMGEKEDYNQVMDNVMQQLLSRELMYDPIKQICDKYPEWLATHRESLPPADYQRYGLQYQSFQRVLAVYETEPENFPRLMELMQDMQEHGQVPAEIIKELAPGLEFNAEGFPVMPNMGEGLMPNLPGFPNPAAGVDPENCCVS